MKKFYRSEIDGLRAIAVLGVIFYHAELLFNGKQLIPGGFLGVDIFFVISGYLITLIIYNEYKEKKNFSYLNFYIRRVKRLVPALLVMIFFSTLLAYFILLPKHYLEYLKSLTSSIFFISNLFFHYSGQAYGENILSAKPLLHTWSLAIEEQFYILYPVILIFILKFFNKNIKAVLIIGIIVSIAFAITVGANHQSFNFYMLPSRSWELLCGAIIAFSSKKIKRENKINEAFFSFIGLLMIIFSFIYFDDVNKHPSYFTILPVFGCCLLLMGQSPSNYINKILSISLLKNLGLISYSLYLWHHPILSFGKISGVTGTNNENLLIKLLLIIVSILLASISYNFIEKIFRKKINILIKKLFLSVTASLLLIIIIPFYSKNYQKNHFPDIAFDLYDRTWFETKQFFKPCFQRKKYFCSFNKNSNNTIFLIGDSVMASIQQELKNSLLSQNFNFIPMTNAGCDFFNVNLVKKKNIFCTNEVYKFRKQKILTKRNATIILHINYNNTNYFGNQKILENFKKDIIQYLDLNYKIILIYPIPQMNTNVSVAISKNLSLGKDKFLKSLNNNKEFININYESYKKNSLNVVNFLDKFNHESLFRIYPEKFFCNTELKNKCIGHNKNKIYFIDRAHLSKEGARLISLDLIKLLQSINQKE